MQGGAFKCGPRDRWLGWHKGGLLNRKQHAFSDSAGGAGSKNLGYVLGRNLRRLSEDWEQTHHGERSKRYPTWPRFWRSNGSWTERLPKVREDATGLACRGLGKGELQSLRRQSNRRSCRGRRGASTGNLRAGAAGREGGTGTVCEVIDARRTEGFHHHRRQAGRLSRRGRQADLRGNFEGFQSPLFLVQEIEQPLHHLLGAHYPRLKNNCPERGEGGLREGARRSPPDGGRARTANRVEVRVFAGMLAPEQ